MTKEQSSATSVVSNASFLPSNETSDNEFAANLPSQTETLDRQNLKEIIESYIRYYAGGDSHTARAKRYDLQYFLEYLSESPDKINSVITSDWTMQKTQAFIDERLSLGEAPSTVSRRLATVKHFGRILAERVPGFVNPAREVRGPTQRVSRPHGLDDDEIRALRWAADPSHTDSKNSFNALRNQFLLELLLATGLRADEVRLLTMGQISNDTRWLNNVRTKGRKFRKVYLSKEIRILTHKYLRAREANLIERFPEINLSDQAYCDKMPVLLSFYKADSSQPKSFSLSPKTVWRIIADIGKRAQQSHTDLLGSLHPHRLRHTFAHGLLDSSKDIRLVAQALGHSDVRTTMRYTERTEEQIAQAIETKNSKR